MEQVKYLVICVDTNDGDYHYENVKVTHSDEMLIDKFINTLKILPTEEDYHYGHQGKVVTGNIIRFENNVGNDTYNECCGLTELLVDKDEWEEGLWTLEEVREEGLIVQDDYDALSMYLPMYLEGGFHSIISLQYELHTDPVVLEVIQL